MYCDKCGNRIPDGETECPNCKEVSKNETPNTDSPIEVEEKTNETENSTVVSDLNETHEEVATSGEKESSEGENMSEEVMTSMNHDPKDTGGPGHALLGFFLPPVGLVLFFLKRKKQPFNAKALLNGLIFGTCTYVAAFLVFTYLIKPLFKPLLNQKYCKAQCKDEEAKYEEFNNFCRCPDGTVYQVEYK